MSTGRALDEESLLLRGKDRFKEVRDPENHTSSSFRRVVGTIAAIGSMVVLGTIVIRFGQPHTVALHSTSLWTFPNLSDILDSSKLVNNLMPAPVKQVKAAPQREMKKASSFRATTKRQKQKVTAAIKLQKKNSKIHAIEGTKVNLQWEDWDDGNYSRQMCQSSDDCVDGFCNMDEIEWGWCEPCSYFESREQCYNDGLPQDGADNCGASCFGGTSDVISTTYAGEKVWSFPISDETGLLSNTSSATQNYKSYVVNSCPDDVMHFSSCNSTSGDGFFRLYDLHNDALVAVMDDSCGLFPALDVPNINTHCGQFRLDVGCYSYTECSLYIEGSLESAYPDPTREPTAQPTSLPARDHEDPTDSQFPFTIPTGTMVNTMTGTVNVKEIVFEACGGDFITLDACEDLETNTGDSYMTLYDVETNDEIEFNDDSCGSFSRIRRRFNRMMGCRQFRLDAGCYGDSECSYTIHGSIMRPEPTNQPVGYRDETPTSPVTIGQAVIPAPKSTLPITTWTGDLMDTMDATQNSYVVAFEVCHGDTIFIDVCGNYTTSNHTNYGDSYIRLMNYGQIPHPYQVAPYASNDDACGLFSSLTSLIHIQEDDENTINSTLGIRCKEFRVEAGCFSYTRCGYNLHVERTPTVVAAEVVETDAPTMEPTVNPHHVAGVQRFPFHIETGAMSHTSSATDRDTSTIIQVHVCPGDYVTISSCGSFDENETGNDSYLNIYDEYGELIIWNDDVEHCGVMSHIEAQMPRQLPGCELFTILAGCFGEQECSYALDGALINATSYDQDADANGKGDDDHDDFYDTLPPQTPSPSEAPTLEPSAAPGAPRTSYIDEFPFTVQTGILGNTKDATLNTKNIVFSACSGDRVELSSCGSTEQDTMFILYDEETGDIRMEADDNCEDGSLQTSLHYTVVEAGCKRFRLSAGYYGTLEYGEGYTVAGTMLRAIQPTFHPTDAPVARPTESPTREPTRRPIPSPTKEPSYDPTRQPVGVPTADPTAEPTYIATREPTFARTAAPSVEPTYIPTQEPTHAPIPDVTFAPTEAPVADATSVPTLAPTPYPTFSTTEPKTQKDVDAAPAEHVVTHVPTLAPTYIPLTTPTVEPSTKPTMEPTNEPMAHPTLTPRAAPTREPTEEPTAKDPVPDPTPAPSNAPVADPTKAPTRLPTTKPSMEPTYEPVAHPTNHPVPLPTRTPFFNPTLLPTLAPNNSLKKFEEREKKKAAGDIEPEPEWIQYEGNNSIAGNITTNKYESNGDAYVDKDEEKGKGGEDATGSSAGSNSHGEVYKENIEDYANICVQKDVPLSSLSEGIVVNPGCVVLADQDLTTANVNPPYEFASIITFCFTRAAGDIILDSDVLSDFGLIFEGDSFLSSVGLGDDTQISVFKEDRAQGGTFKRFLGAPARESRYDVLYSLASNKYMGTGVVIGGNVFSLEMKNSIDALSDCAATIKGSSVGTHKATRKHLELFMA